MYTVYAARCKENGKIYIGCTSQTMQYRVHQHLLELRRQQKKQSFNGTFPQKLIAWQEDYNKYGEDAFEFYEIESGISENAHRRRESFWIEAYKSYDPRFGYNLRRPFYQPRYDIKVSLPAKAWETSSEQEES